MKRENRKRKTDLLLLVLLAGALALSGCSLRNRRAKLETGDISDNSVVMLVGGEAVRFNEVRNYCYFLKCQYEGSFGEELWEYPLGDSETIGDQAKQEIVNMITQVKIIAATAREQNVSLTSDEQDEALQRAENIMNNATKKDRREYSLSVQNISSIYQENALANKMFFIATDDADTSISDEEARQVALEYIELVTDGKNRNGVDISLDAKAKGKALERAKALRKQAESTDDFLSLAVQNTEVAQAELVMGRDTDKLEKKVAEIALTMQAGEISDVIEGKEGYYILHCVSDKEEDATRQRKEEIILERQTVMFMEKYAQWMQDKDVDINQSFWNDFSI